MTRRNRQRPDNLAWILTGTKASIVVPGSCPTKGVSTSSCGTSSLPAASSGVKKQYLMERFLANLESL